MSAGEGSQEDLCAGIGIRCPFRQGYRGEAFASTGDASLQKVRIQRRRDHSRWRRWRGAAAARRVGFVTHGPKVRTSPSSPKPMFILDGASRWVWSASACLISARIYRRQAGIDRHCVRRHFGAPRTDSSPCRPSCSGPGAGRRARDSSRGRRRDRRARHRRAFHEHARYLSFRPEQVNTALRPVASCRPSRRGSDAARARVVVIKRMPRPILSLLAALWKSSASW